MRLLIREHAFSWTDRFHVTDEEGNDRYFVEGEFFSFGRKLHITTPEGREVARVEQEVFRFRPRYTVLVNGQPRAQIVREFTFFRPVYTVEGPGWQVEGNFWEHEYRVTDGGQPVISISKEWFTWGDSYELDILNPDYELISLGIVLAIDTAMAAANTASSAST